MSKKRSFFERLAGNLRFDDDEDESEDTSPVAKQEIRRATVLSEREERHIAVSSDSKKNDEKTPEEEYLEEEVGELPVDVYETPNEIVIQTLIAGVLPEHLSISISRDTVSISGKREANRAIHEESYHIRELYWGSFGRSVHLPSEIEIDAAEAMERHGMLIIKLPKIDKQRKTTLKIKSI